VWLIYVELVFLLSEEKGCGHSCVICLEMREDGTSSNYSQKNVILDRVANFESVHHGNIQEQKAEIRCS
jgi:hypothetical protein